MKRRPQRSPPLYSSAASDVYKRQTEQRDAMYKYFGTSADKVRTIIVTHSDEVKYMEGIVTAEQIGNTTNSCAYVEPTNSGGIKVKTANLNFVTSAMIASTPVSYTHLTLPTNREVEFPLVAG